MSDDPKWTAETADLVADAIVDANSLTGTVGPAVTAILAALADAGLLMPPGGEVREWGVEVDLGHGFALRPWVWSTEEAAREYTRAIVKPKRLMCRTVVTGPWRPVDTEGEQP